MDNGRNLYEETPLDGLLYCRHSVDHNDDAAKMIYNLKDHIRTQDAAMNILTQEYEIMRCGFNNRDKIITELTQANEDLLQQNKFIREGNECLVSENCEKQDIIDNLIDKMNDYKDYINMLNKKIGVLKTEYEELKDDNHITRFHSIVDWTQPLYTVPQGHLDISTYLVQKEIKELREQVSFLEEQAEKTKETYDKLHQEKEDLTEAVTSLLKTVTGEEVFDVKVVRK